MPAQSADASGSGAKATRLEMLKEFAGDKAFWRTLVLRPGNLEDVAKQLASATGYKVVVSGPALSLHDLGMPWNRAVKAAVVLDILQRQPFLAVSVSPWKHVVDIRVELWA
jgi:hypothetical protein